MMKISLSHEPILWIGLIVVLYNVITGIINGDGVTETTIDALISAIGAVLGRQLVSPVEKG